MSILDQIKKTQFQESVARFNPVTTLNTLMARLNDKEKDVIKRRFGLNEYDKQTLEEIGKQYSITRERVRQIENLSIKKLKELQELKDEIRQAEKVVAGLLEQHGGIMEETYFLENLLSYLETHPESHKALLFLAEHIFSDNVSKLKQNKEFNNLWKLGSADDLFLKEVVREMVKVIETSGLPIKLSDIMERFKNSEFYQQNKNKFLAMTNLLEANEEDVEKILESYLRASRKIKQNLFDEWGLTAWGTVQPKKINDKIYLTMKKAGRPMHFTEISQMINDMKFDEKVAYPATVHNELILDDKYVLVGRGIYALKEWGYQPGTVAIVVENVLRENGAMTKDELINKVLEQRNVKKSTIYLSLMNNKKIKKNDKSKYELTKESAENTETAVMA